MPSNMARRRAGKRRDRRQKGPPQSRVQAIAQRNAEYEEEDTSSESEEWYSGCEHDPRAYQKGGYFKVEPGQKLNNRYRIQKRLGWGHFSMVYLAKDMENNNEFVALKIQKSSVDYQEAAEEEIPFLEKARDCQNDPANAEIPGCNRCAKMTNSFVAFGPHGKHYVMVFEVLGMCSAELCEDFRDGLPPLIVKKIMKDILEALSFLHDVCGIVHMDLKPENVLFDATEAPTEEDLQLSQKLYKQKAERTSLRRLEKQLEKDGDRLKKKQRKALRQKIEKMKKKVEVHEELERPDPADRTENFVQDFIHALDPTYPSGPPPTGDKAQEEGADPAGNEQESEEKEVASRPLRPKPDGPLPRTNLCDLGTACWKGELNKFEVGTRYGRPPEMLVGGPNGPPADVWAAACLCLEYLSGDPFFDPENEDKDGNSIDVDEEHLRLITEALGQNWPKSILEMPHATNYFDRKARLRKAGDCPGLNVVLRETLGWEDDEIAPLAEFLLPMFHKDPSQRASAKDMAKHPWLEVTEKDTQLAASWLTEMLVEVEDSTSEEDEEEGSTEEDEEEEGGVGPEIDDDAL